MKKADITYIVCSVFAACTAAFYCVTIWFSFKMPRYYPLERTWKWVKEQGVPSQGWYGKQLYTFLAAGLVTAVVYFLLKRKAGEEGSLGAPMTRLIGVGVTVIIIISMGLILYHEYDKFGVFDAMSSAE